MAAAPNLLVRGREKVWVSERSEVVDGCGFGGVGELVSLVHEVHGDLTELVSVLSRVVSAEEKLAAGLELDAKVCLGTAAVAAVLGRQRLSSGGKGCCHIGLISLHRCHVQRSRRGQ
jgi:hypothetical protein